MRNFQIALCAALLAVSFAGCRTRSTIETSLAHPSIEIYGSGVKFQGKYVMPQDVPDILERHGVSHDTTIHIRLETLDRLREAQAFRGLLAKHGYRRSALVTREHAESSVVNREAPPPPPAPVQEAPRRRRR